MRSIPPLLRERVGRSVRVTVFIRDGTDQAQAVRVRPLRRRGGAAARRRGGAAARRRGGAAARRRGGAAARHQHRTAPPRERQLILAL
ncbi:hypothetical protein [Streptomyces sp. NPDC093261]|uniref:hypothetical protein n=1 Tax=Streptomyces sp. NPDC093261 TaxID=3366037 RepID=UPI00380DDF23